MSEVIGYVGWHPEKGYGFDFGPVCIRKSPGPPYSQDGWRPVAVCVHETVPNDGPSMVEAFKRWLSRTNPLLMIDVRNAVSVAFSGGWEARKPGAPVIDDAMVDRSVDAFLDANPNLLNAEVAMAGAMRLALTAALAPPAKNEDV